MRNLKNIYVLLISCLLALAMTASVFAGGSKDSGTTETFVYETKGPSGESPTSYDDVVLSDADMAAVRQNRYKAAILMHESTDWVNAVIAGARDMFGKLGIDVVAVTDAQMDSNKQRTDIETALALKPDIIVTLVVDPVSGAVALRQAINQGVKVVLISNLPSGFVHGKDYAGIVTDDLFAMGKSVAEMIGDSLGGKGEVALMFHDADYYVTNQRDKAVEAVLRRDYPEIKIVTKQGIVNPSDGDTITSAILTQYPRVNAVYAPWDSIAEGTVAAVRASGRKDVGVFTIDLGANSAMDLVKGGSMKGMVADLPYVLGETLAKMGALSALGKDTPAFVTVPAIKVTKDNIRTEWQRSLNRPLPPEVQQAMQ
ncbi:substrate-binding domain-containing protein [Breznakiella homolactica]|uniref:Substrate-binding domain-containing protein n=1 Tax=Breznakiella homolactica TaxID=2798577 RepID=A0A7T8BB85_9SPIR|nr:substrate-binding domain-containing protein [Breznakiella homolactica]QQO10146.1 substrate-binding domain-containing protein [Breznakiella homolactica]